MSPNLGKRFVRERFHYSSLHRALPPPLWLLASYVLLALIGGLLLYGPGATTRPLAFHEALFTAVSAVTVTGLIVVDTGSDFTPWGQIIILSLIQIGGFGVMTFSVLIALQSGKRLDLHQQRLAQEALNVSRTGKIWDVARAVIQFTLVCELAGIALLTLLWRETLGWSQALYHAFFHSISAFNNAGFALAPNNLIPYVADIPVTLVISGLLIAGGLGFPVLRDLQHAGRWRALQAYTRLMLVASLLVNGVAWILLWGFERHNPATLGALPLSAQLNAAWLQAVTPRTAGFNSVPIEALTGPSTLLIIVLMFIGGGSCSTAGGIKLSTLVILLQTTLTYLRQRDEITLMRRVLPRELVFKAFAITVMATMWVVMGTLLLSIMQEAPLLDELFEVVSALSTVGLSRGLTTQLTPASQSLIMILMLIGRVGPLSLAYLLATPKLHRLSYPRIEMPVG